MASKFLAVSTRLSPFTMLLCEAEKFRTSALSLFSAISNDDRVLVLGSKKRFTTVLPLRVGTFFTSRVEISFMDSAVSRMILISSAESSPRPSICFFSNAIFSGYLDFLPAVHFLQVNVDHLVIQGFDADSRIVGLHGELPPSPVHEHGELDRCRPSVIHD